MGIDPITHKPISQLLSEYGKISNYQFHHNFKQEMEKPAYDLLHRNQEMDSVTQFQVLPKQEIFKPQFFNESTPSNSFASSSRIMPFGSTSSDLCEPFQVTNMPSPLACNDYVQLPDCEYMAMLSLNSDYVPPQEEGFQQHFAEDGTHEVITKCSPDTARSSEADSFVYAILAHDSKMQLQFPSILDETS